MKEHSYNPGDNRMPCKKMGEESHRNRERKKRVIEIEEKKSEREVRQERERERERVVSLETSEFGCKSLRTRGCCQERKNWKKEKSQRVVDEGNQGQ